MLLSERLAQWKQEREALKPSLEVAIAKRQEAELAFDIADAEASKIMAKFDRLDRKIAEYEKLTVVPTGRSGKKKTKKREEKPVDLKALYASMTDEEKIAFIQGITGG